MTKKSRRRKGTVFTPEALERLKTFPPTVTISGLAAALAPIAPDVAATTQAIRHWTREGLLPPAEHLHSGPGKHREYVLANSLYVAALLHLFNDLGLPISGSPILADALEQVRREVAKRKAGKGKKKPHLIIAGGPPTGMTAVGVYSEGENVKATDAVLTIDIDLEKLFAQVQRGNS